MSTDLDDQLAGAYPSDAIRTPAADGLWERGQEHRRRRRAAGMLAGTGVATLVVVIAAASALTLPGTELPTPVIAGGDHNVEDEEQEPPATNADTEPSDDWSDVADMLTPEDPERYDYQDPVEHVDTLWFQRVESGGLNVDRLCEWADMIAEREGVPLARDSIGQQQDSQVWVDAVVELTGEHTPATVSAASTAGSYCGYLG